MSDRPTESQSVFAPLANLLRVAAVQLARQTPEDRAALLPYVKRDMARVNGRETG